MVELEIHTKGIIESVDETLSNFLEGIDDGVHAIAMSILERHKVALGGVYLHHAEQEKCAKIHLDIKYKYEEETSEITVYCDNDIDGRILWLQSIGTASVDLELVNRIYELADIKLSDEDKEKLTPQEFWFNPTFNHIALTNIIQNKINSDLENTIKEAE